MIFKADRVLPALGRLIGLQNSGPGKCQEKGAICSYNVHADGVVF
ncbi:hypothetical protein CHK_2769 [Christensenella hongkongensis]|uniref:Uncharacterized protein n=1 Tax=Christensenella hongkongensis TaxID=270498 RepID=A0A0M2NB68_9FIRM|nr:hypothetical protein CHK_2769 [Christensenella hongkongensis]